jgi:uncharacterized cupredoxin-like copper-binding protein
MRASRAIAVAATFVLSAAGLAAAFSSTTAGRGTVVKVTEKEMAILASPTAVPAGKVTLVVTNRGTVEHELVLMRWNKGPKSVPVNNYKADEGKRVLGEVPELAPGKTGKLKVTLRSGRYLLICNVPGHYMLGMAAPFTVR